MSIASIMSEVVEFRNVVAIQSPNSDVYHTALTRLRKLAYAQKLKREQYAVNELINAMTHEILVQELTLAYQVNGKLYAVHKIARLDGGIPNCLSADSLIGRGYTSAEWDSFPKFHVWVKTGIVHAPVL